MIPLCCDGGICGHAVKAAHVQKTNSRMLSRFIIASLEQRPV